MAIKPEVIDEKTKDILLGMKEDFELAGDLISPSFPGPVLRSLVKNIVIHLIDAKEE